MHNKLFVIAVASEKGGVGKTTIATNLAVYLKALREDLPVTIASFDNHFSVDNMFAISRSGKGSVAALLASKVPHRQVQLGEYGVQYFPSDRSLPPLRGKVEKLGEQLAASELAGILLLDTRPILDDYTISALLAADLVLVPVKDRASLVNAEALRHKREAFARPADRFWLVPSLIDGRLRIQGRSAWTNISATMPANATTRLSPAIFPRAPRLKDSPAVSPAGFQPSSPTPGAPWCIASSGDWPNLFCNSTIRGGRHGPNRAASIIYSRRPLPARCVVCSPSARFARQQARVKPAGCTCIYGADGADLFTRIACSACWPPMICRLRREIPVCWFWISSAAG